MIDPQKILAFDVGVSTSPVGWAFLFSPARGNYETGSFWAKDEGIQSREKSWRFFYKKVRELMDFYKPDTVTVCRPMGHFAGTIYQQAKQVGVIEMICEFRGIQFIDKPDTLYRTTYWGKKLTKKQSQKLIGIADDNEADALVAAYATPAVLLAMATKKKEKKQKKVLTSRK